MIRWHEYFKRQRTRTEPAHHYLADLSYLVYQLLRSWTKGLPDRKPGDFLKEFRYESEAVTGGFEGIEQQEETQEETARRSVVSMSVWCGAVFGGRPVNQPSQ